MTMTHPTSLGRTLILVVVLLVCSSMGLIFFFMAGLKNFAMSALDAAKFIIVYQTYGGRSLPIEFDISRSNIVFWVILISAKG
jgi:hypothetical protein